MLNEATVTGCLTREAIKAFQKEYKFEGRNVVEVQKEVLMVLEHDGYLRLDSGGYVFVSRLVRDWWDKRNRLFYTRVLERGVVL